MLRNKRAYFILTVFGLLFLACGGGGGGSDSTPLPAVPQSVTASNADSKIVLSWGKATGATSYRIYWSTAASVSKETGTLIPNVTSPYAHTGLTNGVTYYYVVAAVNQFGESAESKGVSATPSTTAPPLPPASVATQASNRTVNIAWTSSESAEAAASYNIYWSISSGVSKANGLKISGVSSPYIHTNLINDTTYYYIITGVNAYGEGNASQEVSATPTRGNIPFPPTGLTAAAGVFRATISWSAAVGATSYNMYWSTSSNISSRNGTKIENVKSPYSHLGLDEDTTYYYVVTSVNGYGESEDSAAASVTIVNLRKDIFVAMGDSITTGYPLNNYDDAYVARLSRMWGKTAVNEGVEGTLSSYGASIIGSILSKHNPRYLTLYYGSNDVGFYDNDGIVTNLRYIIDKTKENGTIPIVATLGPFLGKWAWRQPSATELNKKIRQMAAEEGIACADLEAALNGNSAYMEADGLHPNSTGHQVIANTFYGVLPR